MIKGFKIKVISAIFILLSVSLFAQDVAKENEEKIKSLQQELQELDALLSSTKQVNQSTANQLKVNSVDDSNLDDETKLYIKQIVDDYVKSESKKDSEIDFLKGQVQLLQSSLDGLKKDVYTDNANINNKLSQLDTKLSETKTSSPEDMGQIKTDLISIKAQLKAINAIGATSGATGELAEKNLLIIQQQEEIELLKQEVSNLKVQLEKEKQQLRFSNSEELKNLKDQNIQYREIIEAQQQQIERLNDKVAYLEKNSNSNEQYQQLSLQIEELTVANKKIAEQSFKKINESNIKESIDQLDDLNKQYETDKKIERLSNDVNQLKNIVASGGNMENGNSFNFNASGVGNYYLIIASRKTMPAIKMAQEDYQKQGISTEIMQNKNKTWYYLTPEKIDTREKAGARVSELRAQGFKGAWWLYQKSE